MKRLVITVMLVVLLVQGASADFSQENDIPTLNVVFSEQPQIYEITLENELDQQQTIAIRAEGDATEILDVQAEAAVPAESTKTISVEIAVPDLDQSEFYSGTVVLEGETTTENIPLAVRGTEEELRGVHMMIDPTSSTIRPHDRIGILTIMSGPEEAEMEVVYELRESQTGEVIENSTEVVNVTGTESFRHDMDVLGDLELGDYYVQAHTSQDNETLTATSTVSVTDPFWTAPRMRILLFMIVGGIIIGGGIYTQRWYWTRKEEGARYVFPVDYSRLPVEDEENYWVGKVAETQKSAFVDPSDLTTHAIVSGSTGSGKSVTASVIVEEALENDVPVVVFDPTAQWTGFVKELRDDNLLEHYSRFDLNEENDPHPYRGIIQEIKTEDPDLDFDELRSPGEITVFTLNQLTTEEFDQAVRKIIDQIFEKEWEESPDLELLIVFDEVHRLLEEYGGQGGYHALEKGAREFRKWGIGLMMCSQVTADFKQAVSGNIMTEIQMQTKSMEDIERVEKKYGEQFAKRISSEDVGVGMIQNSNYNDGDPWFVDFRPTYHNPHKIPDKELEKYHELSQELSKLRDKLSEKEEGGEDVRDKDLELQLAENKLKEGRFKMAKMYIDSLKDEMNMS